MDYTFKPNFCAIENLANLFAPISSFVPALVGFDTLSRLADLALRFI